MEQNIKVFLDHVGHTIVAEVVSTDKTTIKTKNPAILMAAPNNNGQLTVQLIPVFFKEFIKTTERENGAIFNYPAARVVLSEVNLDDRLLEQYVNMFKANASTAKAENKEAPTIKLFDE